MINYKNIILNKLLDKYENSKSLIEESNRKISLNLKKIKEYDIENYEAKNIFHQVIFELEKKGLVKYEWKKHEIGNIFERIYLNKENVDLAYNEIGRIQIKCINNSLINLLKEVKFQKDWLKEYREDMIEYILSKHKPNNLFNYEYGKDILKVLKIIDTEEQILKRALSIKCFGDSKYFENNIEHIIIRIINKYLLKIETQSEYTNSDVLLEVRNLKISRNI